MYCSPECWSLESDLYNTLLAGKLDSADTGNSKFSNFSGLRILRQSVKSRETVYQ